MADKHLFSTAKNWVTVRQVEGSNFCYAERRGIDSVSVCIVNKHSEGIMWLCC